MPQVALAMIFVLGVGFGAGVAYLAGHRRCWATDVDDEMRGRIFALLQSLIRVVLILGAGGGAVRWSHQSASGRSARHRRAPSTAPGSS